MTSIRVLGNCLVYWLHCLNHHGTNTRGYGDASVMVESWNLPIDIKGWVAWRIYLQFPSQRDDKTWLVNNHPLVSFMKNSTTCTHLLYMIPGAVCYLLQIMLDMLCSSKTNLIHKGCDKVQEILENNSSSSSSAGPVQDSPYTSTSIGLIFSQLCS